MKNYFSNTEQSCECCGLNKVPDWFLKMMNDARSYLGLPIYVNSWTRCPVQNKKDNGSITSTHLKGLAVDVRLNKKKGTKMNSHSRYFLIAALLKAGFKRIVIYDTFIHVDADPDKPSVIAIDDNFGSIANV